MYELRNKIIKTASCPYNKCKKRNKWGQFDDFVYLGNSESAAFCRSAVFCVGIFNEHQFELFKEYKVKVEKSE